MKISQKPWATVLIFIGAAAVAVVVGILVQRLTRRPEVFARLTQADQVTIWARLDKPVPSVKYTGVELSQIIEAIQNSRRDRGLYNTPVSVFVMDFYKGEVKIATLWTSSGFFRIADGKRYRTADRTLERLVDDLLYPAVHRKAREEKEKGP